MVLCRRGRRSVEGGFSASVGDVVVVVPAADWHTIWAGYRPSTHLIKPPISLVASTLLVQTCSTEIFALAAPLKASSRIPLLEEPPHHHQRIKSFKVLKRWCALNSLGRRLHHFDIPWSYKKFYFAQWSLRPRKKPRARP